jgi:hypothetical protein
MTIKLAKLDDPMDQKRKLNKHDSSTSLDHPKNQDFLRELTAETEQQ